MAYDRLPLPAAYQLQQLWKVVRADLESISTPVLLYRSAVDHVVETVSARILLDGIRSADVEERVLERSYHVATLDYDADLIFTGSTDWIAARI